MQNREIEKLLQEKADKTELKEFSVVWEEIKGEIKQPVKEKRFKWKKWFPMVLASTFLAVCLALSPIIINSLTPPEEVYFTDELSQNNVLKEEMLNGLTQAKILHADLSAYTIESCKLLVTEDNKVKGAFFNFYDEQMTFFAEMQLYDKTVDLGLNLDSSYDSTCTINSAEVYYKLKQENAGFYEYTVYAVKGSVQYVMEYTGVGDNLTNFLNEFFE